MNIKELSHIHFTGIKGVGMTALALCAQDAGIRVTGSDVGEEFVTDITLKKRNIAPMVGFSKDNLQEKPDLVVTTGAHGGLNNPEVLAAKELGIPVMTLAEALPKFTEGKKVIAVCGVGGKTSTSSMIATILDQLGLKPSFAIGVADIPSLGTPGRYDKEGEYFVVEADEYAISPGIDNRPRFSLLSPYAIVVTNIVHDHPDIYPTFEDTKKVYVEFIKKLTNQDLESRTILISNSDNETAHELYVEYLPNPKVISRSYSLKGNGLWNAEDISYAKGKTIFHFNSFDDDDKKTLVKVTLSVPGDYNIYNALAAITVCSYVTGKPLEDIVSAIEKYTGCKRRFEKVGENGGIIYYDDYAHHPDEVKAAIKATREWFKENRVVVLFQPHTFSRTKALMKEFSESFNEADVVCISDIFASAREPFDDTINSEMLVNEIKKNHSKPEDVMYTGDLAKTAEWLKENLKEGDVFITLGAGDVYKVHNKIIQK